MSVTFTAAPGVLGSVQVGGVTLCASSWSTDESINVIPVPTFCGGYFNEQAFGKKSEVSTITGPWDLGVNPFSLGFKLGTRALFIFRINNVVTQASYLVISDWVVSDDSDGIASYVLTAVNDGTFNDFSNTAA